MQYNIPFIVRYETEGSVSIDELIDALSSFRTIAIDGVGLFPELYNGLIVEHIEVRVREITHESPLKEVFWIALFVAFQEDLTREVPEIFESTTGVGVPDRLEAVFTAAAMITLYYGVETVQKIVSDRFGRAKTLAAFDRLVDDLAKATGKTPEAIRKLLEERYKKAGDLHRLARKALAFFRPSKSNSNAPIEFGKKRIERDVILEIPQDFAFEDAASKDVGVEFRDEEIEIHAQDRDKSATGWAGLIPDKMTKRVRMKLVDDVTADQLWQRGRVRADGIVLYRREGDELIPREIHLSRLLD